MEAGREGEALAKVVRFPYHPEYNARLVLAPETGFERLACDVIVVATNEALDAPDCPHAAICAACGPDFQKALRAPPSRSPRPTSSPSPIMQSLPGLFSVMVAFVLSHIAVVAS